MEPIPIISEKLSRLSDSALDESARRFARREKRNGAAVIAHLAEISRRDLHLKLGYRDLFEYVEDRLGFRGGSAGLRIHVAKKARDFPRLLEALWREELCLSGAALLAPHLTRENVERLVEASARRSTREIKESLRGVDPHPAYEPGIRKQSRSPQAEVIALAPETGTTEPPLAPAGEIPLRAPPDPPAAHKAPPEPRRTTNVLEAAIPETYNFRFSAGRGFRQKIDRLAEVLGVRDPVRHMGEILEKAMDCLLERRDPERRRSRRLGREERRRAHLAPDVERTARSLGEKEVDVPREAPGLRPSPLPSAPLEPAPAPAWEAAQARAADEPSGNELPAEPRGRGASRRSGAAEEERQAGPASRRGSPRPGSRRPRAADWDEALARAGYQCEFRGRDGRRCTARTGLEPDHYPVPWAVSRSSDPDGIRVHCAAHNSLTAREYFGKAYVEAKIAAAQARRRAASLTSR